MKDKFIYFLGAAVFIIGTALFMNYRLTSYQLMETDGKKAADSKSIVITEPGDTRDWAIYKHEKLRFSIKYPDNVVVWKNSPEWVVFTPKEYSETDYFPAVAIQVIDRGNSDNSVETALLNETPIVNGDRIANSREVKLNNAVGLQVMLNSGPVQRYYLTDTEGVGPVVVLFLGNDIEYLNPDISQLEKMLTTFRFDR